MQLLIFATKISIFTCLLRHQDVIILIVHFIQSYGATIHCFVIDICLKYSAANFPDPPQVDAHKKTMIKLEWVKTLKK